MSETGRNTMIGLFMVAGLGALGVLMVIFGETPSWLGGAEYEVRIQILERATGISEGTPIFMNGIQIGRVADLEFIDPSAPQLGVYIVGNIEETYVIPGSVDAVCVGPLMGLGRGHVELTAHESKLPPIKAGDVISGTVQGPLDDALPASMMASLDKTVVSVGNFAEELTPVAADLHDLFVRRPIADIDASQDPEAQRRINIYTAVQRLELLTRNLNDLISDPRFGSGITESVENIRLMTADGRTAFADLRDTSATLKTNTARLVDTLDTTVAGIDRRFNELADKAVPVLDDSARTAANLRIASGFIAEGKGTVGKLITDDRLYEVATLSFERAVDMIDSLRRLFARFERTGRIGIDAMTPIGPVAADQEAPR